MCTIHIWLDFINCRRAENIHKNCIYSHHLQNGGGEHILQFANRETCRVKFSMLPPGPCRYPLPCGVELWRLWRWYNMVQRHDIQELTIQQFFWLVVLTILKNISQWEGLSHILWKIKHVPNHQPVFAPYQFIKVSPAPKLCLSGAFHFQLQFLCGRRGAKTSGWETLTHLDHLNGFLKLNLYQIPAN